MMKLKILQFGTMPEIHGILIFIYNKFLFRFIPFSRIRKNELQTHKNFFFPKAD
jgi:hypothetical protein